MRIAEAIANIIRESPSAAPIGLLGDWGAGKSTTIEFLKDQVANDSDCRMLVFDAWAHEGDPLRRAFLTKAIDCLIEAQWVEEGAWKSRRDELSADSRVTSSVSLTRSSWWTRAIAGTSLIGLPVGLAFLQDSLTGRTSGGDWVNFGIGLGLIALPFAVWAAAHLFGNYKGIELSLTLPGPQETTTVEARDPTSIQFAETFTRLLKEGVGTGRRLITVLDNLDRLPREDAMRIWTSLRVFFDGSMSDEFMRNVWLVVAFNPVALERDGMPPPDQQALLDRLLPVSFRVPPPQMSDWRSYASKHLSEAFPDHDKVDLERASRWLYASWSTDGFVPTPRQIKSVVNQIGVVHRVFGDEVPVSHAAVSVLAERSGLDVVGGLRDGTLPSEVFRGDGFVGLRESMASVAFGATLGAVDLLLAPTLRTAVLAGDGEKIERLMRDYRGFEQVLDGALSEVAGLSARELAGIGRCIDWSPELEAAFRRCGPSLRAPLGYPVNWEDIVQPDVAYIQIVGALCEGALDFTWAQHLVACAASLVADESAFPEILRCTLEFCDGFGESSVDVIAAEPTCSANTYLDTVIPAAVALGAEQRVIRLLPPAPDMELLEACTSRIASGRADSVVSAIQVLLERSAAAGAQETLRSVSLRLNSSADIVRSEAAALLEIALALRPLASMRPGVALEFAEWFKAGPLMNTFAVAAEQSDVRLQGLVLTTFVEGSGSVLVNMPMGKRQGLVVPAGFGRSADGWSLMKKLLQTDANPVFGEAGVWLSLEDTMPRLAALAAASPEWIPGLRAIGSAAIKLHPKVAPSPDELLTSWSEFDDLLSEDALDHVLGASGYAENLVAGIIDLPFQRSQSRLYYRLLLASGNRAFEEWLAAGLVELSSDEWQDLLVEFSGWEAETVAELRRRSSSVPALPGLVKAFRDAARQCAGGLNLKISPDLVLPLLEAVGEENDVRAIRVAVLDSAESASASELFFTLFGEVLNEDVLAISGRWVRTVALPVVEAGNGAGMEWLRDATRSPRVTGAVFADAARNELRRAIEAAREGPMGQDIVSDLVRQLETWRVRPRETQPADASDVASEQPADLQPRADP